MKALTVQHVAIQITSKEFYMFGIWYLQMVKSKGQHKSLMVSTLPSKGWTLQNQKSITDKVTNYTQLDCARGGSIISVELSRVSIRMISDGISSKSMPCSMASKCLKNDGPEVCHAGFKSPGCALFCLQITKTKNSSSLLNSGEIKTKTNYTCSFLHCRNPRTVVETHIQQEGQRIRGKKLSLPFLVCNHGISQAKGMQFISSVMHCQTIPASQQHTFTIGPSGIDLQDGSSPQASGATCTKG
jgi:hypothetical protein